MTALTAPALTSDGDLLGLRIVRRDARLMAGLVTSSPSPTRRA